MVSFRFSLFTFLPSLIPIERTLAVSRCVLLAQEVGKNSTGKREGRRQRGAGAAASIVAPFKAVRAPSTSQNICYGHEERKVTGYTQGVLNTSCLLGIVTFLAKQQQRRECWYYIAWPPPFSRSRSPNDRWWWLRRWWYRYTDQPPSTTKSAFLRSDFSVLRIGNPETILGLRDRPTREKFDVDLDALSPASEMPRVNFGSLRRHGYTVA